METTLLSLTIGVVLIQSINAQTSCDWEYHIDFKNNDHGVKYTKYCPQDNTTTTFDFKLSNVTFDDTDTYEAVGIWNDGECHCTLHGTNYNYYNVSDVTQATCNYEIDQISLSPTIQNKYQILAMGTNINHGNIEWENEIFLFDEEWNNQNVTVGTMKFGIKTNKTMFENKLRICYSMVTETDDIGYIVPIINMSQSNSLFDEYIDEEIDIFTLSSYITFYNDMKAKCIKDSDSDEVQYDDISVNVQTQFNPFSFYVNSDGKPMVSVTANVCYEFDYCSSGNINYDPMVYYEGEAEESRASELIHSFAFSLFIYSLCLLHFV